MVGLDPPCNVGNLSPPFITGGTPMRSFDRLHAMAVAGFLILFAQDDG